MTESPEPAQKRQRTLLVALFVIYLVLLTWAILWKLAVPWVGEAAFLPHPIKLVPFLPSGDAGVSNPFEVAANVLLFVPFAVYLGLLAPRWRWWMSTGVFLAASVLFETAQYVLSTGSADISDVISNTAGGLAGLGLLALARRRFGTGTHPILTRGLAIATVVAVVGIGILWASPLRYGPQHDVVVHGTPN